MAENTWIRMSKVDTHGLECLGWTHDARNGDEVYLKVFGRVCLGELSIDSRIMLKYTSGEIWCQSQKKTVEDSEYSKVRHGCQRTVVPGSNYVVNKWPRFKWLSIVYDIRFP